MKRFKDIRILVADDYEINQQVVMLTLNSFGVKAQVVFDGQDALEMYKKQTYDLILMDLMMPVMDGIEATEKIRAWEQKNQLEKSVIIAITANHIEKKVKELLAKGFDAIITKPFVPNDIREVLTKHFQF